MNSRGRFSKWWNFHRLGSLGRSDAWAAWQAQDEYYGPIIKEKNERIAELKFEIKQAIVYMETENPGNTFRLMCLNGFRATLDEMEKANET